MKFIPFLLLVACLISSGVFGLAVGLESTRVTYKHIAFVAICVCGFCSTLLAYWLHSLS